MTPRTDLSSHQRTCCCICGRTLDPTQPLAEERPTESLSSTEDWFYCLDCWFTMKAMCRRKADAGRLARALERVLLNS